MIPTGVRTIAPGIRILYVRKSKRKRSVAPKRASESGATFEMFLKTGVTL
jgi:hypothetical protein